MAKLRFQTKFISVYMALFLLLQGLVVAAVYVSISTIIHEQIRDQLSLSGRVIERLINNAAASSANQPVILDQKALLSVKKFIPIDIHIAVLDNEGGRQSALVTTSDARDLSAFLADRSLYEGDGDGDFSAVISGTKYLFRSITIENKAANTPPVEVLIYSSLEAGRHPFQLLAIALAVILAFGLMVLFWGSLVVSKRVTGPLQTLARAAQKVSAGEYQQVSAPARDAEIQRLTESFNQMVAAVRDREERITYQACHDDETGLPNRVFFEEKITPKISGNVPFSLGVVEIQNLPDLRAVLTHDHVSEVVRAAAHRLNNVNVSYLSQLSMDTFVFAVFESSDANQCSTLIIDNFEYPLEAASAPTQHNSQQSANASAVDLRVCIGLTMFPADGETLTSLLRNAYSALDHARLSGQGFAWYHVDHDLKQKDRLSMMGDLRSGLDRGEVQFFFQPKLELASDTICCVEALIQWASPTRGRVPLEDFIPLAEKTGDIKRLTAWALKTAVEQIAEWQKAGIDLVVAVNLSTEDLMNTLLPQQILALLNQYSVSPAYLKLEVTESVVMDDLAVAREVLSALSDMGLKLSIDDYGTGYSSLSYIKDLPVGEIKIDKSFILQLASDDDDKTLVRSTIELAHNLGLQVTAEGVENAESLALLKDFGCDRAQGFYISRPIAAKDMPNFLNEYAAKT